jgi:hypothetical protein
VRVGRRRLGRHDDARRLRRNRVPARRVHVLRPGRR